MNLTNFTVANIMLMLFFSAAGMAYFVYGKKQRTPVPFVIGILLMGFPYFISNTWAMGITGFFLLITPFLAKRFGL